MPTDLFNADSIPFLNDFGSQIPGFAVLKPTGCTDVSGRVVLKVTQPDGNFVPWYLLNGPTPVPAGGYGAALSRWPVYAQYGGGGTPAWAQSWGPVPNQWYLGQYRPGFYVVGDPTGGGDSGPAIVAVKSEVVHEVLAKLSAALPQGGSVSANVYGGKPQGVSGGGETDTGLQITVYDRLLSSGNQLSSGTWVICRWLHGYWYVVEAGSCPTPEPTGS